MVDRQRRAGLGPQRDRRADGRQPRRDLQRTKLRQAARGRHGDQPLRRRDEIVARATKAAACPIRCNTRCSPPARTKRSGSRTSAAGSPDANGKPARAHGIVRVINERHDQEERLTYLSRFDGLTGEMNRFHLTEVLETTLKQALAQRNSCGFMLVAIDNLARINEVLRLRRRRRGDRRGGQAPARQDARRRSARPLLRQQVRHHPQQLHARRHGEGRRAPGRRRARRRGAHRRRSGRRHRDHRRRHRAAPCRERAGNPGARAGDARSRQGQAAGLVSRSIARTSSARRCGATTCAPPTRSSNALNERRILLAFEPVVATPTRQTGVLRMPDAHPARRRLAGAGAAT